GAECSEASLTRNEGRTIARGQPSPWVDRIGGPVPGRGTGCFRRTWWSCPRGLVSRVHRFGERHLVVRIELWLTSAPSGMVPRAVANAPPPPEALVVTTGRRGDQRDHPKSGQSHKHPTHLSRLRAERSLPSLRCYRLHGRREFIETPRSCLRRRPRGCGEHNEAILAAHRIPPSDTPHLQALASGFRV